MRLLEWKHGVLQLNMARNVTEKASLYMYKEDTKKEPAVHVSGSATDLIMMP